MSVQSFFEVTRNALFIFLFAALVIGFVRFKMLNIDQRLLLALLVLTLIVESFSILLWNFRTNNNFLFHFYSIGEFLLLAAIYMNQLTNLIKPCYMRWLMVIFAIGALGNTLFLQPLTEFNSQVAFAEGLLLIILALAYFLKIAREKKARSLKRNPMFWINVAVLTYFSGALILFYIANDLIPESYKVRGVVWGVHALFNIFHYALYAVALSISAPEKTF